MLVSGLIPLDLSALLQLVLTALALLSGALLLVRKAASRYFFVDASFDSDEPYNVPMSIGGSDDAAEAAPVPGECAVCRDPAPKKCSRCKSVRYCSSECQLKHWECHKLNCKQAMLPDKADKVSSDNGLFQRRKLPGFNPISLVPARGKCKILREPKRLLFPYEEFVKLFNWDKPGFLPCGLVNCGNSCFVNVVLQCLASTRPLVAYLMKMDHSRGCSRKVNDWCFLCELQIHIQKASESSHPFSPINILSRLPNIGGNLGCGNQEDAHELMRFAIDTMQSVCLDEFGGEKAVDFSTQETTLIQYIFGGHLQSQVICTKCNMISNRYENMMDLTVEIQGDAASLQECLDQFTIKERLDGENMYKCDGCNDYVKAWKRLTVHQAPNILTIALKRFQSGRFGKLNKRITFPESLDLAPYMSNAKGDGADLYNLYAVVVHVDTLNASFFGHYICYTKDYHGRWYRIDDNKVVIVEVEDVLSQGAYMLLYSRRHARREPFVKPVEPAEKKHVLEMAPETSLCRDTGHNRSLSIESSYAIEERERVHRPIPVAKEYEDVDMDDSEPIASKLKDIEGKSDISRAEDSSIQVEAMDCVVQPAKYIPEHSFLLENSAPSMVETSSSVSATATSLVPDPSYDASPSLEQVLVVPGPSVSSNGAKTTEEHTGEDAEEDVLVSHISKVNGYINGHVGNDACLDSPSLNSKNNTPPGSGMSFIAKGNCNGFAGHDSLGSHSGNGKAYMTPGFLNKSYSKPMRVNRN